MAARREGGPLFLFSGKPHSTALHADSKNNLKIFRPGLAHVNQVTLSLQHQTAKAQHSLTHSLTMKRQSLSLKTTGSLINYLMGNNSKLPVIGEGATILHYSDREACEVVEISADGKSVVLEGCDAIRTDKNGMSDEQEYRYELNGNRFTIVWRNNAWRRECSQLWFTEEALAMTHKERTERCYDLESTHPKLVAGLTFVKKSYPKINIVFGVKQAYHDYSF